MTRAQHERGRRGWRPARRPDDPAALRPGVGGAAGGGGGGHARLGRGAAGDRPGAVKEERKERVFFKKKHSGFFFRLHLVHHFREPRSCPPSEHHGRHQAGRQPGLPPEGLHRLAHGAAHHPLLGARRQLGLRAGGACGDAERSGDWREGGERASAPMGRRHPSFVRVVRCLPLHARCRTHVDRVMRILGYAWTDGRGAVRSLSRPLSAGLLRAPGFAAAAARALRIAPLPAVPHRSTPLHAHTYAGPGRLPEAARADLAQHDGR